MLTRLWSPAFKKNGNLRPVIDLHAGLNIVEGEDETQNLIGKSTLLQIIDFVYAAATFSKPTRYSFHKPSATTPSTSPSTWPVKITISDGQPTGMVSSLATKIHCGNTPRKNSALTITSRFFLTSTR